MNQTIFMKKRNILYGLNTAFLLLTGAITSLQAQIVINEALTSNDSYPVEGSTCDWIELYNNGTTEVSLQGMSLSLSTTNPRQYSFPAEASIPAKGYYVIRCDSSAPQNNTNTGFNLPASGGTIFLYSAESSASPIDTLDYGPQIKDFSSGRTIDGTGTFNLCIPTPGAPNQAQTLGSIANVKVNECCAGPDDWLELYNAGNNPVALGGYYLTTKPSKDPTMFKIHDLTFIGTGSDAFLVYYADEDTAAGKDHVNFKLGKTSDDIALMTPNGGTINVLVYPDMVDNESYGRIPDGATNIRKQPGYGSPGKSNYLELETVVINELMTHSDPPETDPDFIELLNISSSEVDISGWGLSDSHKNRTRYVFPNGTIIQPGGFLVVTEYEFSDENNPNCNEPFKLNSYEGDSAILTEIRNGVETGYRSQVDFGAAPNNFSFIRVVNTDGQIFYPLSVTPTMEAPNSDILMGPLVINELHYRPAGTTEPTNEEFIEIFNITDQPVELWYPDNPEGMAMIGNGVTYTFPIGTVIEPGQYALIVPFSPDSAEEESFRIKFNVPAETPFFGPYSGKLSNDGETIDLLFPDKPESDGFIPYYAIDSVRYTCDTPWPTDAKATGKSLQRLNAFEYANQSSSWGTYLGTDSTLNVTPGRRSSVGTTDQDFDQMPDDWELTWQFDPFNPADANEDANGDGITNLQHYLDGTNPREQAPVDPVEITAAIVDGNISIQFQAQAGVSYEIQTSDSITGTWTLWETVEAGEARSIILNDTPSKTGALFYRVVTVK